MIVNIIPGKGSSVEINNGETIASNSKIGADDILSTLSVTNENAAILTSDLLKITTEILKGKGIIGVLLNDTLMAKDLKQSVGNFKRASKRAIASIDALNEILQEIKTNNQSTLGVLLHDSISGGKIKNTLKNLEVSSVEVQKTINMANVFMNDFKTSEGAFNYVVRDTALVHRLETILNNVNEGTVKFSENMEALKYNFLTRGYFRRLERQQRKAKEAQ
jgi:phospholipid/cholesterol/gamma-HCH transport system substrate-binding protein